jgi:adenine-specific DNA-methyltransferase
MTKTGKLELTWVGKYETKRLEPRILIEDKGKSNVSQDENTDNMLIHGDNLLALKALVNDFSGKIKCICIDPPYNTGSAFEHYDDGIEHSIWLSIMNDRLQIMKDLLSEDGSIWISIDDNECHYLKVLCDEVFGRKNFIANVIWEKADSPRMDAKMFSSRHDYILVYARDQMKVKFNQISNGEEGELKHYNKIDSEGRKYYLKPLRAMGVDGTREARPSLYFPLIAPDNTEVYPKNQDGSDSRWRWSLDRMEKEKWRIEWIKGRKGWTANYRVYAEKNSTKPPETIWFHSEVGSNRTSKKEAKEFNNTEIFATPKPERLVERILTIATEYNDIVLDSFLGSGTTVAVAHKMKRKWIGIELGDHAYTHCKIRMDRVIEGEQGGASKSVNWSGGGGYRFYELAPSLFEKHNLLPMYKINKEYSFEMLCEAICKLEGFKYAPQGEMHGKSSESRFIHIATDMITGKYINHITKELSEHDSILIYGTKVQSNLLLTENIEVKRIPKDILEKFDFESEVR